MADDRQQPAVVVEDVSHRFDAAPVLQDCSFTVPAGAVVALLGRNGAGKTTLLRSVVGLLRPDRGRIKVQAGIGYVAQHAPLYRMLTVAQTLRLGGRLNPGWDAAFAQELADDAGLPAGAKVGRLADGQRTRLALVMALGKRPEVLVLDEPLAGLDPVARTEIVGTLMAEVADRGTTVLMSSHVVADIESVCDHVVVLGEGRARLAGGVEAELEGHWLAMGAAGDAAVLDRFEVIELRQEEREFTAVVRIGEPPDGAGVTWHRPTLEELLMGYLRAAAPPRIREVSAG